MTNSNVLEGFCDLLVDVVETESWISWKKRSLLILRWYLQLLYFTSLTYA